MQERLMAVGGRLAIESQTGIGTTVLAEVGLPHSWDSSLSMPAGIFGLDSGEERPNPTVENWAWLGQKLVIPVGQAWPWLPADRVHLRGPLVEPGEEPLVVRKDVGFLGLGRDYVLYVLRQGQRRTPLVRVERNRSGYEWETDGTLWALRRIGGLSGRTVLLRNGQPLAAVQYQGRLLNTWSEIIYDGRGYGLCYAKDKDKPDNRMLIDEAGDECLFVQDGDPLQITLRRALPLPLLVMVAIRVLDEGEAISATTGLETAEAKAAQAPSSQ